MKMKEMLSNTVHNYLLNCISVSHLFSIHIRLLARYFVHIYVVNKAYVVPLQKSWPVLPATINSELLSTRWSELCWLPMFHMVPHTACHPECLVYFSQYLRCYVLGAFLVYNGLQVSKEKLVQFFYTPILSSWHQAPVPFSFVVTDHILDSRPIIIIHNPMSKNPQDWHNKRY